MKTVNHIIGILDILLGAGALIALIAFLSRLKKTVKAAEPLTGSLNAMNGELQCGKSKSRQDQGIGPVLRILCFSVHHSGSDKRNAEKLEKRQVSPRFLYQRLSKAFQTDQQNPYLKGDLLFISYRRFCLRHRPDQERYSRFR